MATLKNRLHRLEQQLASKQKSSTPEPHEQIDFAAIISKIKAAHAAGTMPTYTLEQQKERVRQTIAKLDARFGW